ncbi:hypothetical protein QSX22_004628 [Salmonella enterica]|nr:hypothetical protein [Salmonella enterica]ELQ3860090.1 hypothetical protein [Salmonella enterica]
MANQKPRNARLSHEKTPITHPFRRCNTEMLFLVRQKITAGTLNLNQAGGQVTEADCIRLLTSGNSGYKAIMKRHLETVVFQKAASYLAKFVVL